MDVRFVDGCVLNDAQLDLAAQWLDDTGYWIKAAINNKRKMDPVAFLKATEILPVLPYLRALMDSENRMLGYMWAMTRDETEAYFNAQPNDYAHGEDIRRIFSDV